MDAIQALVEILANVKVGEASCLGSLDALQALVEVAAQRQTPQAAEVDGCHPSSVESSQTSKFASCLGSLMPSKLWLKSQPNVKLRRLLSRWMPCKALVEILQTSNLASCWEVGCPPSSG